MPDTTEPPLGRDGYRLPPIPAGEVGEWMRSAEEWRTLAFASHTLFWKWTSDTADALTAPGWRGWRNRRQWRRTHTLRGHAGWTVRALNGFDRVTQKIPARPITDGRVLCASCGEQARATQPTTMQEQEQEQGGQVMPGSISVLCPPALFPLARPSRVSLPIGTMGRAPVHVAEYGADVLNAVPETALNGVGAWWRQIGAANADVPWDPDEIREHGGVMPWLCGTIGASTPRNVAACLGTLAVNAGMTPVALADLLHRLTGATGTDDATV